MVAATGPEVEHHPGSIHYDMHTLDDLQNPPPPAPDTTADMFEHLSMHALSGGTP